MVSQVSNAATDVTSESPDTRPTQMRRDIETPMFLLPDTAARDGQIREIASDELTIAERQSLLDERDIEEQERCEHGVLQGEHCGDCDEEKGHLSCWSPPWSERHL